MRKPVLTIVGILVVATVATFARSPYLASDFIGDSVISRGTLAFVDSAGNYYGDTYTPPSWDTDYTGSVWSPTSTSTGSTGTSGNTSTGSTSTGSTSTSTSTSTSGSSADTDWSTYTEPHNYGIAGLEIPAGAIGIKHSSLGALLCLEGNLSLDMGGGLASVKSGDTKIYDKKGTEVGVITVFDAGPSQYTYQLDYGYFYPERMYMGGSSVYEECKPSWYSPTTAVEVAQYEWDPALDINDKSVTQVTCSEGYKRNIRIRSGAVYDAENGENLYDHGFASYNSSTGKIGYPSTGAIVGMMENEADKTGFVCIRLVEKDADTARPSTDDTTDNTSVNTTAGVSVDMGTNVDTTADTSVDVDDTVEAIESQYDSINFKDVPYGEWYYEPVWYAAAAGWIKYDVNFRPNDPMSRCEFAKVLMLANGVGLRDSFQADFLDVPADHWGAPFVYTGFDMGFWSGVGEGKFGCDNAITREQAAKMIANAVGMQETDEDNFTPADVYSDWALPYIRRMHAAGFMTDKDGVFDAGGNFTRAQAMKVFYRIFKF